MEDLFFRKVLCADPLPPLPREFLSHFFTGIFGCQNRIGQFFPLIGTVPEKVNPRHHHVAAAKRTGYQVTMAVFPHKLAAVYRASRSPAGAEGNHTSYQ